MIVGLVGVSQRSQATSDRGGREVVPAEQVDVGVAKRRQPRQVGVCDWLAGGAQSRHRRVQVAVFHSTIAFTTNPRTPSWSSCPSR